MAYEENGFGKWVRERRKTPPGAVRFKLESVEEFVESPNVTHAPGGVGAAAKALVVESKNRMSRGKRRV